MHGSIILIQQLLRICCFTYSNNSNNGWIFLREIKDKTIISLLTFSPLFEEKGQGQVRDHGWISLREIKQLLRICCFTYSNNSNHGFPSGDQTIIALLLVSFLRIQTIAIMVFLRKTIISRREIMVGSE